MLCFEVISRHLPGCEVVPVHVIKTRGSVGIAPLIHNRALDVG
jgi:hypothetical protein